MEGLQNFTQAYNLTYRELVRQSCNLYGVPPNYYEMIDSVFVRDEAKNETFIKGPSYFVSKESERLLFRDFLSVIVPLLFYLVGEFQLIIKKNPNLNYFQLTNYF